MRAFGLTVFALLTIGWFVVSAFAAGDAAKGKVLFNDPHFAQGTAGMSCNSCHPNGKGLESAADKKNLPAIINNCIENALKGKAIDSHSAQMADLVAYIDSLKGK